MRKSPVHFCRLSPSKIFFLVNLLFILVIFSLGFYDKAFRPDISHQDLVYYNDNNLALTGRVCEEADLDYKSRRLTICVNGQTSGQILLTSNLYPSYDYGDFLKIEGKLQTPPLIDGFNYSVYLARYDIYSVMYYPKIVKITGSLTGPQSTYHALISFKQGLKALIDSNLPEPEAGLADALLLGYRRTVEREDLNIFARVGLSHMIAISGSHITILSTMIINFFLALGFSRRRSLFSIFIFLGLYPLVTGLAASAVRSAIMGALTFLAVYYERLNSLLRALVFAAALMLLLNPRLLRDDIGFQLSFLAILGIVYLYPLSEKITHRLIAKCPVRNKIKKFLQTIIDMVNLCLVSQIVILPIALINFKQLSLIAPLANILVLWTFPLLLASLIVGVTLSAIMPAAGVWWFLPACLLLKYIFIVSNWLALPHWAAMTITGFN